MWLILRRDKALLHTGLVVGRGHVLHYASRTNNKFDGNQAVRLTPVEAFAHGRRVGLVRLRGAAPGPLLLARRALGYYGRCERYSLVDNNCLCFVLWCLRGKRPSVAQQLRFSRRYHIDWPAVLDRHCTLSARQAQAILQSDAAKGPAR